MEQSKEGGRRRQEKRRRKFSLLRKRKHRKNGDDTMMRDEEASMLQQNTRVVPLQHEPGDGDDNSSDTSMMDTSPDKKGGATAILEQSYLEMLCGNQQHQPDLQEGVNDAKATSRRRRRIPEDPTVAESIEVIFASELEKGLGVMQEEMEQMETDNLVAPSSLQQSMLKNRASQGPLLSNTPSRRRIPVRLSHIGTFDPVKESQAADAISRNPINCVCCHRKAPLDPSHWPQKKLLLRPQPGSGTRVKGIRFSGSTDYLQTVDGMSTVEWPRKLAQHWGKDDPTPCNPMDVMCSECIILPINNGNEPPGECLVTDFESDVFEGTLLVRLRGSCGTTAEPYDDRKGYFAGMNRRYQVVIQGKFKKEISFTACRSGFWLDRPCGKLPAKWIAKGCVKVISFFAPQLQIKVEGEKQPYCLTPLGSTPQCLSVRPEPVDMERLLEEPTAAEFTLLNQASMASTSLSRARYRKRNFDKLYTHKSKEPVTRMDQHYVFEFLQHLVNFDDFSVELGAMIGQIHLKDVMDGQPLQIMALHEASKIWSFELWHEQLYADAKKHDDTQAL